LQDFELEENLSSHSISLYDDQSNDKYFNNKNYQGFSGKRISFVFKCIIEAKNYDHIFIGHINMALVGYLIKLLYPKKNIVLIAHGYEVWYPLQGFKKALVKKADLILAVSSFTKNKLVAVQGIDEKKVGLFYNTLDPYFIIPSSFAKNSALRKRYGINESDFVIFTLARLAATEGYKGYDIVIKCLPEIIKSIPNIKYVISGKYDATEKMRLDKYIKELKVEKNVVFTGYLKDAEVEDHYQMGDLFIMPSIGEGFGIVFLEAMACGLPVIAGNLDGSVDALKGGELGALVNPNSELEITEKVKEIFNNKAMNGVSFKHDLQQRTLDHFGFDQYKKRLRHYIFHNN
jgi:glycosyltransferase involved in cell wall biosynthesis